MRRVKIVCTIGPASDSPEILRAMIQAGMDVARLNMSHGDHAYHAELIRRVRTLAHELRRPIAILVDLQGPKLRVGRMQEGGVPLRPGEEVILTSEPVVGEPGCIPIQNPELPGMVKAGERILLDDGLLELMVEESDGQTIRARVVVGGLLEDNKGMNLPDTRLELPSITEKDKRDVAFALEHQADWIALSFVRAAEDVHELRKLIVGRAALGRTTPIIAKIEKPEAVRNIDAIIEAADGIMVARGDLGIETSPEAVPMIQKMIIARCNRAGKPVITATQMLDSMIRNPRPTRAEASDVANAVLDGSDALMLSGETALGRYPVQSVQTMVKIAEEAERVRGLTAEERRDLHRHPAVTTVASAVGHAAVVTAEEVQAAAIITPTVSGSTAKKLSFFRPCIPIIAVTPSPLVYRQLALYWGVSPLMGSRRSTTDEVVEDAVRLSLEAGYVDQGDTVVVTGGTVGSVPGVTNLMTVRRIAQVLVRGQGIGDTRVVGRVLRIQPGEPCHHVVATSRDIVVAEQLSPECVEVLRQAGGVITREGDRDSFVALAAVELGVPAVVGAQGNWEELTPGRTIVVDAQTGNVYDWTE